MMREDFPASAGLLLAVRSCEVDVAEYAVSLRPFTVGLHECRDLL